MDKDIKKPCTRQEQDDFWDIDSLIPSAKCKTYRRNPGSTDAVDITFDVPSGEKADACNAEKMKNDTHLTDREQAGSIVKKYIPPHTAREYEKAPVPDDEYIPAHPLIHRVRIFDKKWQYNYYEQFLNHARRICALRGKKCTHVPFFSYVPQYSQLSKDQLDWYLWWRECVWNGSCMPTDFSYILLYIYEIINTGGHGRPSWGQEQLCFIWREYGKIYPRLSVLGDWICDFSLIHHLPPPHEQISEIVSTESSSCMLKEFYMGGLTDGKSPVSPEMLLTFCTNYHYKKSKFYIGDAKKAYDTHIPKALELFTEEFLTEDGKLVMRSPSEDCSIMRDAYSGALCSYKIRKRIEIGYTSFSQSYELRFLITDLIKYCENKIRASLGIKSRLGSYALTTEMRQFADKYFDAHLPKYKKPEQRHEEEYEKLYEAPKTGLSPENAAKIELLSWNTTEKLIEAFEPEENQSLCGASWEKNAYGVTDMSDGVNMPCGNSSDFPDTDACRAAQDCGKEQGGLADFSASDNVFRADFSSPPEKSGETAASRADELMEKLGDCTEFVKLAYLRDFDGQRAFASKRKEMCDLMADRINETACEIFGDVILEEDADGYVIIDEYRKEFCK